MQAVPAARPRLVVGIVVDQLRTDYIEYLSSYFGEKGFRTLMGDGVYFRDVDYQTAPLDAVSATASLFTGAYPAYTGVPQAFVHENDALHPALATEGVSITNDSFSPERLRLTTISDEIAVDGNGTSLIYSVATDPQQAVVMAGHAGKSALWINNTSGNWAGSSYYGALPTPASTRNLRQSLYHRLDTMTWSPSARLKEVPGISDLKKKYPFKHRFNTSDKDAYNKFNASALANAEVTDMAIALLSELPNGGETRGIDMLNIGYTLAPFKYAGPNSRAELADSYLRLDSQLSRLIEAVDRYVGRGNALIWLTSTGYYNEAVAEESRFRLPGGEFSGKRAKSLLNSYLSARHGNATFVKRISEGRIYLDHKAIEGRGLQVADIARDARDFIVKMSGVDDAYTLNDILTSSTDETERLRRGYDPRTGGDIILRFTPGWTISDDETYPVKQQRVRESGVATPAFIMGPGVEARRVIEPVKAIALAPTVAGMLRIRAPNGARERSLF